MSPLASWMALGALIFLFFVTLWLLSGEPHDGESVDEEEEWPEDGPTLTVEDIYAAGDNLPDDVAWPRRPR